MTTHELDHWFHVEAGRRSVWAFLWRVEAVARCIPGCVGVTTIEGAKSYTARIKKKVGPFSVGIELAIEVKEMREDELLVIEVTGNDRRLRSQVTQQITIRLESPEPEVTRVAIQGSITIEGLLGSLNKNLVSGQVSQILNDFSDALRAAILAAAITARVDAGASPS